VVGEGLLVLELLCQWPIDGSLQFSQKGQEHFEAFIQDRLLPTSKISVWDSGFDEKIKTEDFLQLDAED